MIEKEMTERVKLDKIKSCIKLFEMEHNRQQQILFSQGGLLIRNEQCSK